MPQPTPYLRSFSFTESEAENPTAPPPGPSIDAEFDAIARTAKGVLSNLLKIQRDDGLLRNLIVTLDSLSPAVIETLGAGSQWKPRGQWAAATAYAVSDVISEGTATYVCATAHQAAVFADELAAGAWVLLYDSAGTIPADGSVSATKLAPRSVTTDAIGFDDLDLPGSIRGRGGIAAGTAPPGSLLHAKKNEGDVVGKVERAGQGQGKVGFQWIGAGETWEWLQPVGAGNFQLAVNGTVIVNVTPSQQFDVSGAIRASGGPEPETGSGVGLNFVTGAGRVTAYDYSASKWCDLSIRGKIVSLQASGVEVLKATSASVDFPKGLTNKGVAVGYLGIPQVQKNTNYKIAAGDVGETIYSANVAAQVITVPVLASDSATLIVNDGSSPITLQAEGVVLRLAGTATTGNRTIGAGGMAFLKWVKDGKRVFVSGPGVS